MTFPAMNLPVALMGEVQLIDQLLRNAVYLGAAVNWWRSDPAPAAYEFQWPDPSTLRFHVGGAYWIVLYNVHVAQYGPIEWADASTIGGQHTDIVNETAVKIPVDKGTYRDTFSATFSETKSLEDETKNGFISEAMAKLGGISSPVQASLNQKVELEFRKAFGQVSSESRTVSQEITLPTPLDITVRGVRSRVTEQRRTKSQPQFDYGIAFRAERNDGGWWEVGFASKAEYQSFIRGEASDSVGVRRHGGSTVKSIWSDQQVPVAAQAAEPQAAAFRNVPQPSAVVGHGAHSLEWLATYDNVHKTGIEVIDHLNPGREAADTADSGPTSNEVAAL